VLGRYDAANPPALRRLVGGGAQIKAFPQDVLEGCYKAANEVYAEHSASNPLFKKLHDSVVAFRGESSIWMQIAELSYDSFIIRMRART
jgi:TRAP-type mannitol/chloroaromatic compound transport system substrate-binding protein